jgi:uncharacterized protein YodC (DUF2158 family)
MHKPMLGIVILAAVAAGACVPFSAVAANANLSAAQKAGPAVLPKAGDLVRVRSGGPLMIVDRVDGDQVICTWTDSGDLRSGSFSLAVLMSPLTRPPVNRKAMLKDEQNHAKRSPNSNRHHEPPRQRAQSSALQP